jgi:hypothetical protein
MMRTLQFSFKIPEDEKSGTVAKCGAVKCGQETRYLIFYEFVYDGDNQILLHALWSHRCEKHGKELIKTLRKAGKKLHVIDLTAGKVKVRFT